MMSSSTRCSQTTSTATPGRSATPSSGTTAESCIERPLRPGLSRRNVAHYRSRRRADPVKEPCMTKSLLFVESKPASAELVEEYHRWHDRAHVPDMLTID